jgi:hypothetical protein
MIHTTGKEALEELYRVHFPGSQRGEVITEKKVWPHLGVCVANREDWELSGRVIYQSKI